MRIILVLLATTALAACGGSDGGGTLSSVGSAAPASSSSGTATDTTDYTQLVTPTAVHTYTAVGGEQVFIYNTDSRNPSVGQQGQTYAAGPSSIRDSHISITYDPTAAIYTLAVADTGQSGAGASVRFQDPAQRIDFAGGNPQWGTLNAAAAPAPLAGFQYFQAGDGNPISPYLVSGSGYINPGNPNTPASTSPGGTASYTATSLFIQKPGTGTQYVTLAGYARNVFSFGPVVINGVSYDNITSNLQRGAFAYGIPTNISAVPVTGTATYTGAMLATMVYNTSPAFGNGNPTLFQWVTGSATTAVDFSKSTVGVTLSGIVSAPQMDLFDNAATIAIPAGTTFSATGTATIDLAKNGGFSGNFASATFGNGASIAPVAGSTLTGAFYGPKAAEVGGGFRIVGGVPNQRVDIVGAFVGK
jgi:hypothetical protein